MRSAIDSSNWIDVAEFEDSPGYQLEHQQGGFLPSEGHALLQLCRQHGIATLIESGRWRGFSTELFARASNAPPRIVSVDLRYEPFYREVEDRLKRYPNVRLLYGNALAVVPHLVASSTSPTALFVDGPKGKMAVDLINHCFELSPNLQLAFLHDSYRGSEARAAVEKTFPNAWFTDDPAYCRRFHSLDGMSADTYRKLLEDPTFEGKYHFSVDALGSDMSYGPTLACIPRPATTKSAAPNGLELMRMTARRYYAQAYALLRLRLKGT